MLARSPTVTPSDCRPAAISRAALSQSAQVAVRQLPASFQRRTGLAAAVRTRLLNSSTALLTLKGRSLDREGAAVAVAATLVVSICEFVRQDFERVKRMLD